MYEKHFGLRSRPFRSTPDRSCYYASTCHEQALDWLHMGLADREGVLLLTGEPGLGKTLLCHCLLERQGEDRPSAFLTHSHLLDRLAVLPALAHELGLPHVGQSEAALRLAITDHLLTTAAAGQPTLLFVDEAQHLGMDALEELRLLANLENGQERALQIVLSGHPSLHQTLAHPMLNSLRQRLAVRPQLEPLSETESADFLLHHLRRTTDRPEKVITSEALELLARGGRGVPRVLSQVAHRAFTLACSAGSSCVDAEAAIEALIGLGLDCDTATAELSSRLAA